ncbi:MAG: type II secretion system F family protein [Burkholderiaceae bacterium]|nr:type II secretion system F family protein [Burkholderiaceae bacterium]
MMQSLFFGLLFVSAALLAGAAMMFWQYLSDLGSASRAVMLSAVDSADMPTQGRVYRDLRVSASAWMDQWLRSNSKVQSVQQMVAQSGVRLYVDQLLAISVSLGAFLAVGAGLLGWPITFAVPLGTVGLMLPWLVLRYRKKKRLQVIEEQLPDALDAISRAMQAGNSLAGALAAVSKESPDPLGGELRIVSEEINFGRSVKDGLLGFSQRLDSLDIRYFVLAVLIHSQTGGNLSSLLSSLATLIRERMRLKRRARVLSAEGRLSGWVLTLLPFITAFLIYLMNPDFLKVLWTTSTGILLLQINAVMMTIGLYWMWKIVHFRI